MTPEQTIIVLQDLCDLFEDSQTEYFVLQMLMYAIELDRMAELETHLGVLVDEWLAESDAATNPTAHPRSQA